MGAAGAAGRPAGEATKHPARQGQGGRVGVGRPQRQAAIYEVLSDGAAGAQEALHRFINGRREVIFAPFGHESGGVGGGVAAQGTVEQVEEVGQAVVGDADVGQDGGDVSVAAQVLEGGQGVAAQGAAEGLADGRGEVTAQGQGVARRGPVVAGAIVVGTFEDEVEGEGQFGAGGHAAQAGGHAIGKERAQPVAQRDQVSLVVGQLA